MDDLLDFTDEEMVAELHWLADRYGRAWRFGPESEGNARDHARVALLYSLRANEIGRLANTRCDGPPIAEPISDWEIRDLEAKAR
ncbi:MAG TPA: hypothetical protein VJS92_17625 [Candidatus Polarisedimenticolaceae bacterium]|nr:hypothetical protein [Candidatus Polarisedimenticolaceae bacterium]